MVCKSSFCDCEWYFAGPTKCCPLWSEMPFQTLEQAREWGGALLPGTTGGANTAIRKKRPRSSASGKRLRNFCESAITVVTRYEPDTRAAGLESPETGRSRRASTWILSDHAKTS